jgi:AcrR family transcriptional regulator
MSAAEMEAPSLRERKHLRARRTILEEATRLFESRGYSNTTLRDIADAAETSIPTLIRYFGSKDAILLDRDRQIVSQLAERVEAGAYATLSEGLRDAFETSLLDLAERERLHDIVRADPACVPLTAAMRRDWEELLEALILSFSPATPEGRMRAKSLAYMLTASGMAGMEFWHEHDKAPDLRILQQDLIDEFMAAFIAPIERAHVARRAAEQGR